MIITIIKTLAACLRVIAIILYIYTYSNVQFLLSQPTETVEWAQTCIMSQLEEVLTTHDHKHSK